MKIQKFTKGQEKEWMDARRNKITGTKLKDILVKRGTGKKIGFYQLIADSLGIPADEENAMERGKRLEPEAIERFVKETGKEVDTSLVICMRDDEDGIAYSPDGMIGKTEGVEVKALGSARHIEALLTQEIPSDYTEQSRQPFVVNDKLQTLYFVFYDPRVISKSLFYLTIHRKDIEEEVAGLLAYQKAVLAEVREAVLKLSGFNN